MTHQKITQISKHPGVKKGKKKHPVVKKGKKEVTEYSTAIIIQILADALLRKEQVLSVGLSTRKPLSAKVAPLV